MSNVIPFPEREPAKMAVQMSGDISITECSELVHVFVEVPGFCHCGESYWDPPSEPIHMIPDAPPSLTQR